MRLAALMLCLAFVAGCALDPISDPAPDPEVAPLEVVVNSSRKPDRPCLLNRTEVRAGDHEVSVIGESGYTEVQVVDGKGTVVLRTDNRGQRVETADDGSITIVGGEGEGEGPSVRLETGTYTVRCLPENGEPGEATLRVRPARPARGGGDAGY